MNTWECVCGLRYEGIEGWVRCYGSHPRRGGFAVIQRAAGEGSQGSAPLWVHTDGRRFNYPGETRVAKPLWRTTAREEAYR